MAWPTHEKPSAIRTINVDRANVPGRVIEVVVHIDIRDCCSVRREGWVERGLPLVTVECQSGLIGSVRINYP